MYKVNLMNLFNVHTSACQIWQAFDKFRASRNWGTSSWPVNVLALDRVDQSGVHIQASMQAHFLLVSACMSGLDKSQLSPNSMFIGVVSQPHHI